MSEFTQITTDTPVVIPAVAEKLYDKKFVSHLRINSSPTKAMVIAHLKPYNGADILQEPMEQVVIDNIFEAMQTEERPVELRTLMAQTMELILQTIKAEMEWKKVTSDLNQLPDGYTEY